MVSKDTLSTNVWDVLYTYLQTTNAISTNNIFSAWNSTLAKDRGYPLVIIYPPLCSIEKVSANGDIIKSEIKVMIEVFHSSAASVKSMKDEVVSKLLAGRSTFAGSRLMNMNLSDGGYDMWEDSGKKIHRLSFDVSFRYVEA